MNILDVIMNRDPDTYQYGNAVKVGILKGQYSPSQLDLCPQWLLTPDDVNRDNQVWLLILQPLVCKGLLGAVAEDGERDEQTGVSASKPNWSVTQEVTKLDVCKQIKNVLIALLDTVIQLCAYNVCLVICEFIVWGHASVFSSSIVTLTCVWTINIVLISDVTMLNVVRSHCLCGFYHVMLCMCGTSHGPVSLCVCVIHKLEFY